MLLFFYKNFKSQNDLMIKKYYYQLVKNIDNLDLNCDCGNNNLVYFGKYERNYITNLNRNNKIIITRVQCTSCNKTHAIIPYPLIPYKQHTSSLIIKILNNKNNTSINNVANVYMIPRSTIYGWLYSFIKHIPFLKTLFKEKEDTKLLNKYFENIYENSKNYFELYNKIFLQMHST